METNQSLVVPPLGPQEFELMTQAQFARVALQSEVTVARWRREGAGPAYLKLGRKVMYSRADIEVWLAKQRTHSTAEYKARRVG